MSRVIQQINLHVDLNYVYLLVNVPDRVGQGPHGPIPPSEPYVTVSRHTAQAFTKADPVGLPDGCTSYGQ